MKKKLKKLKLFLLYNFQKVFFLNIIKSEINFWKKNEMIFSIFF